MPFPVSRSRRIEVRDTRREQEILVHLKRRLRAMGASEIELDGSTLQFQVKWSLTNRGPLFVVDAGRVSVAPAAPGASYHLAYTLSFKRAALILALQVYGVLGLWGSISAGDLEWGSVLGTLLFCTIGYCWLLGVAYLIVPGWFERRLKRRDFPKRRPQSVNHAA